MNTDGGGVAFIGTAADSYPNDVFPFEREYLNTLFDDSVYKLGDFLRHTSMNTGEENDLYRMLQLLGDPDLSIFTAFPVGPLAFAHDTSITTGNQDFVVNGPPLFPIGLENIMVSVYKEGEVLAYATVAPGDFPVTFNITPDTPGELKITATGHNLEPYEGTAQVTTNAAVHLYKTDNLAIDDENNNGTIEPGETINVSFELHNTGQNTASNTSAVLSTADPNIQITQNTSSYQNISSGQTKTSLVDYTFVAPEEVVRGLAFRLDITASGPQGTLTFTEPFLLNVKTPDLQLGDWDAIVNNTEVNTFSANDNIDLFFDIKNQGSISAEAVQAVLTTTLPANLVSITDGNYSYGNIGIGDEITNDQGFSIVLSSNYAGQNLPFQLELTDDLGNTKVFDIDLTENYPNLISGFDYTAKGRELTLFWDHLDNIQGYNIYRGNSENGPYQKVNSSIRTISTFHDMGLQPSTTYWYKIGVVSNSGNEGNLDNLTGYPATTIREQHGAFPIKPFPGYGVSLSSPIVFDVDGNGTKEIFATHYNYPYMGVEEGGRIMCFYENGTELFDIDGDNSTAYGFARTVVGLSANPAIGDLDNDGHAEVIAAGRDLPGNNGALYGFHTLDENDDGKPDKLWDSDSIDIGWKDFRNPVLSDMDADGHLDILVMDERQKVTVYDVNGTIMGTKQIGNNVNWSEGELAVANLDTDAEKEIIISCKALSTTDDRGAIYKWDFTDNSLQQLKVFSSGERADNGPVLADINHDNKYEILTITRTGNQGRIYALRAEDGSSITGWENIPTFLLGNNGASLIPRIAVGDIDGNGDLEIVFGSKNSLFVLTNQGTDFPGFPVENLEPFGANAPVLADVDADPGIEILINAMGSHSNNTDVKNSNGVFYVFNNDGSMDNGFPSEPNNFSEFVASPFVGDIDNDGMNEVVINSLDNQTYVWDTTGDADKVEWGSYRGDAQNTGVYETAECMGQTSPNLDLMVKDNTGDTGQEPNPYTPMWTSKDIWVRNQPDGLYVRQHENPEYDPDNPVYVYVRVTNQSCATSSGDDQLVLYWSKANTSLTWPDHWDGSLYQQGVLMGEPIGALSIPSLEPGQEVILEFEWNIPDPQDYSFNANPWHFCLLDRILSQDDPIGPDISSLNDYAAANNNVAWKNTTVIDVVPNAIISGSVAVGNPFESVESYTIEFTVPEGEDPVFEEAEVGIELSPLLMQAWTAGGKKSTNLRNTRWNNIKIVSGNHAKLENLIFQPQTMGFFNVGFNFLTEKVTETEYTFYVAQKETDGGKVLGGESYVINRDPRALFKAKAGEDKIIDENESITIQADTLNEPATYNWYDPEENLVYTGKDFTVSPEVTKKYKLEIIADSDGYKDYDEIEIKINGPSLNALTPNPTSGFVTIDYDVMNSSSAYIMITNLTATVSNNFILDVEESEITVDMGSYTTGAYIVSLVCDGELVDSKNLIKE